MLDNDNISRLFEINDTEQLFTVNKEQLRKIEKNILLTDKEINTFIDERVHPKSRKMLYDLIDEYKKHTIDYSLKEREQVYKTGFADAIKIILDSVSI